MFSLTSLKNVQQITRFIENVNVSEQVKLNSLNIMLEFSLLAEITSLTKISQYK